MGTAVRPAKTSPGPWDAFADVDAFVDEVLVELAAMAKDGSRPIRSGPKPPLAGAALRKAVMASGVSAFAGCSGGRSDSCATSPSALYGLFARWTGSAFGGACSTGCAAPGASPAAMRRSRAPW